MNLWGIIMSKMEAKKPEVEKSVGYHKTSISKGVLGELSKIREELEEAFDAEEQNNKVMVLVELSDIIGAISLYIEKNHNNIKINDLVIMSEATRRSFIEGERSCIKQ